MFLTPLPASLHSLKSVKVNTFGDEPDKYAEQSTIPTIQILLPTSLHFLKLEKSSLSVTNYVNMPNSQLFLLYNRRSTCACSTRNPCTSSTRIIRGCPLPASAFLATLNIIVFCVITSISGRNKCRWKCQASQTSKCINHCNKLQLIFLN